MTNSIDGIDAGKWMRRSHHGGSGALHCNGADMESACGRPPRVLRSPCGHQFSYADCAVLPTCHLLPSGKHCMLILSLMHLFGVQGPEYCPCHGVQNGTCRQMLQCMCLLACATLAQQCIAGLFTHRQVTYTTCADLCCNYKVTRSLHNADFTVTTVSTPILMSKL